MNISGFIGHVTMPCHSLPYPLTTDEAGNCQESGRESDPMEVP